MKGTECLRALVVVVARRRRDHIPEGGDERYEHSAAEYANEKSPSIGSAFFSYDVRLQISFISGVLVSKGASDFGPSAIPRRRFGLNAARRTGRDGPGGSGARQLHRPSPLYLTRLPLSVGSYGGDVRQVMATDGHATGLP
eukprot:CAMPEP_0181254414 /NCGR_PEP_ID=MMETSP1096-20121128/48589_1 /TAXON_ID=156174 ORGANISM="Chrysochromulina ericina, Strain CCMP281" /NCGR_SAMPLE_ID=MMETSP1096 /ASSEMBLY_ACC=CAM_ASM_000453 /LENGTH=140 /DNA_ID=CAMNT_0023352445 /DNA_START=324 /DNA_END=743 /DNA_ORIENTATION=-